MIWCSTETLQVEKKANIDPSNRYDDARRLGRKVSDSTNEIGIPLSRDTIEVDDDLIGQDADIV